MTGQDWAKKLEPGFLLPPGLDGRRKMLRPDRSEWNGWAVSVRAGGRELLVVVAAAFPSPEEMEEMRGGFPMADEAAVAVYAFESSRDEDPECAWVWARQFDASLAPAYRKPGAAPPPAAPPGAPTFAAFPVPADAEGILSLASEILGRDEARAWMSRPLLLLGGKTPAESGDGARCHEILMRHPRALLLTGRAVPPRRVAP